MLCEITRYPQMSPPSLSNNNNNSASTAAGEPQRKRARRNFSMANSKKYGTITQDPATGLFSMLVRSSVGGGTRFNKSIQLSLTEPAADEECNIGLEPIAEYRLPFMPADASLSVTEGQRALTKASLPCGHGFNALALLYHFTKNSMTCPFCRAGHAKVLMSELSIPLSVRGHFTAHLAAMRAEENKEQTEMDAIEATRVMEQEVRRSNGFLPLTRVVLLLFAYDSMDGSGATEPVLALELPLTSSLSLDTLVFASFGYSVAQLNLNLLRLPTRPTGFEIAIGLQSLYHGSLPLFRTARFPSTGPEQRVVFARDLHPSEAMAVHVSTMAGVEGFSVFCRMTWIVSAPTFSNMLVEAARVQAGGDGMVMAAV